MVDKRARFYRTCDSDVVSSSLLQLVLLQRVINGYGYNNNNGTPCDVSAILERLDGINSSIKASVAEAVSDERSNTSSVINDLTDEVRQSTDVIMTLVEVVDSSRRAIESLTATVTHLSSKVEQLQQCCDGGDGLYQSCEEIRSANPDLPSGYYNITVNGTVTTVYSNMDEVCGSADGWTRVAYLNMSDPQQQCPSTLQLYQEGGVRACGRMPLVSGCRTVGSFSSNNIKYTEVCGRVIGYQYYSPDGFSSGGNNISDVYVDGVSLTYGSPRNHIWTFAATATTGATHCPCGGYNSVPSEVINHYFCESGSVSSPFRVLYTADPLWDGEDCNGQESPCCASPQFTLPWFHRVLDTPTSDNIDMRACFDFSDEDAPLELYEIYIK